MNGQTEEAGPIAHAVSILEERLGPQFEQVRERLTWYNQRALRLMREQPAASLALAVGVGFLIGRMVSRR